MNDGLARAFLAFQLVFVEIKTRAFLVFHKQMMARLGRERFAMMVWIGPNRRSPSSPPHPHPQSILFCFYFRVSFPKFGPSISILLSFCFYLVHLNLINFCVMMTDLPIRISTICVQFVAKI